MSIDYLKFVNDDNIECRDLLQSNSLILAFDKMVSNSDYSVYSITGGWGTGKTCFVQMWENLLENNKQTFVHINAFKMDYETEPFLMLIRAFKEFMSKKNIDKTKTTEWIDKAKKIFTIKNITKLGFNVLLEKTLGSTAIDDFVKNIHDSCFDTLTAEKSMYDELVFSLTEITKNFDKPVYIIIDELDRCRPDFALETLERIKHIFYMKNVKFILVYNDEVMQCIIRQKYGSEINAERYLSKFIQKPYVFNHTTLLIDWFHNEVSNSKEKFAASHIADYLNSRCEKILSIKKIYNLTLRDIRQILCKLKQHIPQMTVDSIVTVISIELLKYINKDEYNKMIDYYLKNKGFASNAPERVLYSNILSHLKDQDFTLTPDAAFTLYMQGTYLR